MVASPVRRLRRSFGVQRRKQKKKWKKGVELGEMGLRMLVGPVAWPVVLLLAQ